MNQQQPVRLNIGAGDTTIPGFIPIDGTLGHDLTKLPYGDGSVDEIYASHVLEHLDRGESAIAATEWMRVLKSGGRIRISVPDISKVLATRTTDPYWEHRLMGGHMTPMDYHKTLWDEEKLTAFMRHMGCEEIAPFEAEYDDSSAHRVSLNLEGRKSRGIGEIKVTHAVARGLNPDGTPIRLNIGGGDTQIPGFINIDATGGYDVRALPYRDEVVDEVYASHVFEHIHHAQAQSTLAEWVRVLKPGGRIRIAIPDFNKVLQFHRDDPEKFGTRFLSAWLHGDDVRDSKAHKSVMNGNDLLAMMRACGIDDIGEWKGEYQDQAHVNPFTLNLGGYKRKVEIPRNPKVTMVLSTPRFGPVDTFKSIADACQSIGWKFYHWGGTEWGKGLETVIQTVMREHDPDYIFCLDYDSVFEPSDCLKMLDYMQRNPGTAAAWPAEAHRHLDLPLGMAPQAAAAGYYDFSGEFTEMWSGHFGCTIIRAQLFKTIPHPWFWSLPDPETGDWQKGSDADLTFWRSCVNFGFKVGQVNTVQIGHLEWCVKWMAKNPDGKSGMFWQPIQHYRKHGRPTQAVFDGKFWNQRAAGHSGPPKSEPPPAPPAPKDHPADVSNKGHPNGHAAKVPVRTEDRIPASDPGDEDRIISTGIANEYQKRLDAMGISGPDPLIKHET